MRMGTQKQHVGLQKLNVAETLTFSLSIIYSSNEGFRSE